MLGSSRFEEGPRQHRPEFRISERAEKRDDTGGDPNREDQRSGTEVARDLRGHHEDAAADHRPDHDRCRIEESEPAGELGGEWRRHPETIS